MDSNAFQPHCQHLQWLKNQNGKDEGEKYNPKLHYKRYLAHSESLRVWPQHNDDGKWLKIGLIVNFSS